MSVKDRRGRLLTVSNRGPVEYRKDDSGGVKAVPGQGGLSTALSTAAQLYPTTWLSSPLTELDREMAAQRSTPGAAESASHFVATDPDAYEMFYGCFANEVLWFLQHGLPWPDDLTPERRQDGWDGYLTVNRAFADAIVAELATDEYAAVMIHDYHFYVAPLLVRQARPDAYLQHFVHIPWPEADEWQRLETETVRAICEGLLANDSLVFQTEASARNFLLTCEDYLPDLEIDFESGVATGKDRVTRVWSNGISADPAELAEAAASAEFSRYRYLLRADVGQQTIVRVDRLDPTKNVVGGFMAYARLLDDHPELRQKVHFLALLVPSKSDIPIYQSYQQEAHQLAEQINARFGNLHWKPIRVLFEHNRVQALAAMSLYDVLLVNPFADGMNLVAKEGPLLNVHDGVLVLSEKAGAYEELGCASLGIDPVDIEETAEALYQGLIMPIAERRQRAANLRQIIRQRDLRDWFKVLLADIERHTTLSATTAA